MAPYQTPAKNGSKGPRSTQAPGGQPGGNGCVRNLAARLLPSSLIKTESDVEVLDGRAGCTLAEIVEPRHQACLFVRAEHEQIDPVCPVAGLRLDAFQCIALSQGRDIHEALT